MRSLEFSAHLQFSLEGRRAESAINDSSCPFDEASWNPNSRGFREHLGWWACGGTGRGQGPSDPLSHTPFPMCLFHPNAHLYSLYPFYNEPVHVSKVVYLQVAQWQRICLPNRRLRFDPWVGKIPWRRALQPTLIPLPGKSMDRGAWRATVRRLAKESDTTYRLNNNKCK